MKQTLRKAWWLSESVKVYSPKERGLCFIKIRRKRYFDFEKITCVQHVNRGFSKLVMRRYMIFEIHSEIGILERGLSLLKVSNLKM